MVPARRRPLASRSRGAFSVGEEPFDLGGAEVGVEPQARACFDGGSEPGPLEFLAAAGRPPALPDDGVAEGGAGLRIPQEDRFSLIGDADGREIFGFQPRLLQRELGAAVLGLPDVLGICSTHPGCG